MPWKSVDVQQQRVEFVIRAAAGKETMRGLCRESGISPTTGYAWRRVRPEPETGCPNETQRLPSFTVRTPSSYSAR